MNKLKVEVTSCNVKPDAAVIDGGGRLQSSLHWPVYGVIRDVVDGVEHCITRQACNSNVLLIFTRYDEESIKAGTRSAQVGDFRRSHHLFLSGIYHQKICACHLAKQKKAS